jgi:beta-glucuronidase
VKYINGYNVVNHTGGHLPFEVDINAEVSFTKSNRVTVAVNNTLSHATIPPGEFVYKKGGLAAVADRDHQPSTARHVEYPSGFFVQTPNFDFFNYAGILRPVYLYSTNPIFIKDMRIVTTIDGLCLLRSFKKSIAIKIRYPELHSHNKYSVNRRR